MMGTKTKTHHATARTADAPVTMKITLPQVPGIEMVALRGLEHLGHQLGIADEKVGEARIIVTEAIINAFEHGGTEVQVQFTMSADELTIFVRDSGKGFDPVSVTDRPDVTARGTPSRRGWGMKLIRRLSDGFEIRSGKRGTTITITKRLS